MDEPGDAAQDRNTAEIILKPTSLSSLGTGIYTSTNPSGTQYPGSVTNDNAASTIQQSQSSCHIGIKAAVRLADDVAAPNSNAVSDANTEALNVDETDGVPTAGMASAKSSAMVNSLTKTTNDMVGKNVGTMDNLTTSVDVKPAVHAAITEAIILPAQIGTNSSTSTANANTDDVKSIVDADLRATTPHGASMLDPISGNCLDKRGQLVVNRDCVINKGTTKDPEWQPNNNDNNDTATMVKWENDSTSAIIDAPLVNKTISSAEYTKKIKQSDNH